VQRFVYYGHHIVMELDGNNASDLTHRYLHGPVIDQILADESVSSLTQAGTMRWPLADNLGTVRDIVDNSASGKRPTEPSWTGRVGWRLSLALDRRSRDGTQCESRPARRVDETAGAV
jgi:hypothetical protein